MGPNQCVAERLKGTQQPISKLRKKVKWIQKVWATKRNIWTYKKKLLFNFLKNRKIVQEVQLIIKNAKK